MNSDEEVNLLFFLKRTISSHSCLRDKVMGGSKLVAKCTEEGRHAVNVRWLSFLQQREIPAKECFLFQWAA